MKTCAALACALVLSIAAIRPAAAQIRVHPTGVNVNAFGATTVFLTFGGLGVDYTPADAQWCGELLPAVPDVGLRCDPATLFGSMPARLERATRSGTGALTDIMSIPPSVARRAWQAAESGAVSSFFYVRRFVSGTGGPDHFVAVTCRLTGGGARTPLSLTRVDLAFEVDAPILHIRSGSVLPALRADISYTGTGRLQGRWEVVQPGDEPPDTQDLLTEATLPREARTGQRRFTEIERFNVFLPPTGRVTLPGPDPARLPTSLDGTYMLLLRIEASDDREGDSSLAAVGASAGVVHAGAVAAFPMSVLRYVVGTGGNEHSPTRGSGTLQSLLPADGAPLPVGVSVVFTWTAHPGAMLYRLELVTSAGEPLLAALTTATMTSYAAPAWLAERAHGAAVEWRVSALDAAGRVLRSVAWRKLGES